MEDTNPITMPDKQCPSYFLRLFRGFSKVAPPNETSTARGSPIQRESLEEMLKDKLLRDLFLDWTAQNLCSENLLFYYEVERFKSIRDLNLMQSEANRIYNKYVRARSVAEVNLDFECRVAIEDRLDNPTSTIFDEAKYVVLDLLKYDLYLKFIESDIYRNFKGLPSAHRFPVQRRRVIADDVVRLSFEQISTLSKCLNDPAALDEFLKFAYQDFSDAVVQFYLDVQRYEMFPSIEFACTIFGRYLAEASEEEVDADPKTKKWIWHQLQHGLCPPDLFSSLKVQIYGSMVQDNFMRFQNYIITNLAMV